MLALGAAGHGKNARLDVRERAEVLLWQPVDHRQQLAYVY